MPSFEKNKKTGMWSVRFREVVDDCYEKNKRISGFKTKKDAQSAYEQYITDARLNAQKSTPSPTAAHIKFSDMAAHYLEYEESRCKTSSYIDIRGRINNHILPYFGDFFFDEVRPLDILLWQQTLTDKGLKHSYKVTLRKCLNSIFLYAHKYFGANNITETVDNFKNQDPKKEMQVWTREQFERFAAELPDDSEHKLFFRFLYISGCRKGEAFALYWENVDFENNTVKICQSLTRKTRSEATYEITTPKNASSNRTLSMPENFMADLRVHKERQLKKFREEYPNTKASEKLLFVFGGTRALADTSVDKLFRQTIAQAGLPRIRIHDLRHSCASLLISEGVTIVAVSRRLGHSDIEMTLNRYSHMMPKDEDRIASILKRL